MSRHLTPQNAPVLLAEARGKSRSELELLIATGFPPPNVAERVEPMECGAATNVETGLGFASARTDAYLSWHRCPALGAFSVRAALPFALPDRVHGRRREEARPSSGTR